MSAKVDGPVRVRPWRTTLGARFLLLVVLGVLLPLGIVGLWLTRSAERAGRAMLQAQLDGDADALLAKSSVQWSLRDGELQLVAQNSVARALLAGKPITSGDSLYLDQLREATRSSIAAFALRNRTGMLVWTTDVRANATSRRRDSRSERSSADLLNITRPVLLDGQSIGELSASVRLSSVIPLDSSVSKLPGSALVIRDSAQLLWSTNATTPTTTDERASDAWASSARRLAPLALDMTLAAPTGPYVLPFERAARRGLTVLVLVALVALIIAVLLTSRLTRSLHALAKAAGQVADGMLDQRVGHISDVGDVAVAFNRMTASLQHSVLELTQQRSLVAVGEFAASLSHEVRNSLTAVRIDLQHANRLLVTTDAVTDATTHAMTNAAAPLVARALSSVRRLDTTVTSALRVARSGHVERTTVRLDEIMQRAMRSADGTFAERGATLLPIESAVSSTVFADAGALEQMFLNVLLNAAQSLSAGGHATVRAATDASLATISITDTGSGVSPADLSAIGTPFFSSKPNGTGLGLPLARRIAEAHGGMLQIEKGGVSWHDSDDYSPAAGVKRLATVICEDGASGREALCEKCLWQRSLLFRCRDPMERERRIRT